MNGTTRPGATAPAHAGTAVGALPTLREQDIRVFEWITRDGRLRPGPAADGLGLSAEELAGSVRALTAVHLLRRTEGGDLVPLAPETAVASLVLLREAALRRRLADTERLRGELLALAPAYADGCRRRRTPEAVSEITGRQVLAGLLAEAAARCTAEVRGCHPGDGALETLARSLLEDSAVLGRHIRLRALYRHTARHRRPARDHAGRLAARGADVRTASELPGPLIVFDEDTAFIPHHDDPDGAVLIRDRSTVVQLCRVFDHCWSGAAELAGPAGPAPVADPARAELRRAIVRLLAEGMTDAMVARRLGMSLRTCRKHIAEVMGGLGARSRFQAGHLLGRAAARGAGWPEDDGRA